MVIYRVGYDEERCRATLYNHGCNWHCSTCSYKLREGFSPTRFFSTEELFGVLSSFKVEQLVILGGEPLACEGIEELVTFAKEMGAHVRIAHSNLSIAPPIGIDEIGVSLRAITKRKHLQLTGAPNTTVLANVFKVYDRGVKMSFTTMLVPDLVDLDEVDKMAEFIAGVDTNLPLHISAFIPVPGTSLRRPTDEEMEAASLIASKHLVNVTRSSPFPDDRLPKARPAWNSHDGGY